MHFRKGKCPLDPSHSEYTHLETVMLRGFFSCHDWKPRHFLFLVCASFIGNVQWQSSMVDLFNMFKVLQNFVLPLGKYSPPSSWTRPSWITGSGCMWEGSLPCCCRLWHEWIQSPVHGCFGAVPFPKLPYIRSLGAGGCCGGCFFNHGKSWHSARVLANDSFSWICSLCHEELELLN